MNRHIELFQDKYRVFLLKIHSKSSLALVFKKKSIIHLPFEYHIRAVLYTRALEHKEKHKSLFNTAKSD